MSCTVNHSSTPSSPELPLSPVFPFSALQGQQPLQTALLLSAIDPLIGGVLIQGPRGTAKSTSARALAELLPQGCFVDLPLGASEEQLIGSLDIEAALQNGRMQFRPGLLAQAHLGLLYVDEVNLLADNLVDVLLDVAASGINRIERDGISHQHDARFVLVGTMNPEEGELRPQLLDRFGLSIDLPAHVDGLTRQQIVRTRLQFDTDPHSFTQKFRQQQQALQQSIKAAQSLLPLLIFSDEIHQQVSDLCSAAHVEGVRADLVMLRAARAHAALHQRQEIDGKDVDTVKEWALAHRRLTLPAEQATKPLDQPSEQPLEQAEDSTSYVSRTKNANHGKGDGPPMHSPPPSSSANPTGESTWGEMLPETSPETVPIQALKTIRPLPLKKS